MPDVRSFLSQSDGSSRPDQDAPTATMTDTPPTTVYSGPPTDEQRHEDLIGKVIGERYQVHRLLGKGGSGAVYYATQIGLDRPVALKVLRDDIVCDLIAVERFRREARAAAKLHHPNIVSVYDFGTLPEICAFIAMEYLDGRSLRDEIRRNPSGLELNRVIPIFHQICSGVHSAHEIGIIHRDLKPQNIMLEDGTGGVTRVKVLDFGIAKIVGVAGEGMSDLTGSVLLGTPHYCSPEQCMGEPLDPRSDVYSLGVVLYQMLTGGFPFDGPTPSSLVVQHVTAPPRPLRRLRPDLPQSVERVVMKALEKRPENRPTTALDLANLLDAATRERTSFITTATDLYRPDLNESSLTTGRYLHEESEDPTLPSIVYPSEEIRRPNPSGPRNVTPISSARSVLTGSFSPDTGAGKRRLAVLPLRNLTRAEDIDFLGFSLADAVIMQLAYVKSLIVRPSSSIERFRDQGDLGRIASALDVDTILTGTFLKAGETLRVGVQLVDVAPNEILWREQFDMPVGDILALQDRISEKIVQGLKLTLTSAELELIHRDVPKDAAAYELFLRAKNCAEDVADTQTAVELLRRSLELDDRYAPAWAELAHRNFHMAVHGLAGRKYLEECERAALRALELNPDLPEANCMLMAFYAEIGKVEDAFRACFRMLEVAPNNELTHLGLGHCYEFVGMLDHAMRSYRRALQINPKLHAAYTQIAAVHTIRGDYEAAFDFLNDKTCTETQCEVKTYLLGLLAMRAGDRDEAVRNFTFSEQIDPRGLWGRLSLAMRLRVAGDTAASLGVLEQVRENAFSGNSCFYMAHHFLTAGETETGLSLLERAVELGYCNVAGFELDPVLAPVRGEARFKALLDRANAKRAGYLDCLAQFEKGRK